MLAHLQIKATPSLAMATQQLGRGLRGPEPRRAVGIAYFNRSELWHIRFNRVIVSVEEEQAVEQWCWANASGWWDVSHHRVMFDNETDAKLFYLAFA